MNYKYLILFPIPEPFNATLCALQDRISEYTTLQPPYRKLPPHITFHRPIDEIAEVIIKDLTRSMVLQLRQTRVTVSHLFPFGKEFIVLPIHSTARLATFWVGIINLLKGLPEYKHGPFEHDNTLHITLADQTSSVFNQTWNNISQIPIETMHIPVQKIELHRKPITGGFWERIEEFDIPA
jgi:2'-5' RNA ligase